MRISKKVREEAAMICAMTASEWAGETGTRPTTWWTAGHLIVSHKSRVLSDRAWGRAYGSHGEEPRWSVRVACVYAEAEALIRTGWSPGDEP